jgi:DNA-directed RNA polymerase subunit N (RpoN/RPB10)
MIIPIKCMTCGKVLADKWIEFEKQVNELLDKKKPASASSTPSNFDHNSRGPILDKLKLTKICCRRHMLGHVNFK